MSDPAYTAPGSGRPLPPGEVAAPNQRTVSDLIARGLVVPRGPLRSAQALFGLSINNNVQAGAFNQLNSVINFPLLPASGVIRGIDVQFNMRTTNISAAVLAFIDGTGALLRQYPISVLNGFSFPYNASNAPLKLPFINGLTLVWTPYLVNGAASLFAPSLLMVNVDYESIPIGQQPGDNLYIDGYR